MRNSLLSLLGLPLVAGFGGLSWVRTAGEPAADGTFTQPATVLRPPGDATFASGYIVMPPSKLAVATRRPSPE